MKTAELIIVLCLVMLLTVTRLPDCGASTPVDSCDSIVDDTRSQICLSGQCPLDCNHPITCDQVCVMNSCDSLTCNSSSCLQRCLSGDCNSLMCTGDDCTQTCLRNCSEVNCTVKAKCNQQCEKGHCDLRAMGAGKVEQTCAENCSDVKCMADKCKQACAGEGCGLECTKGNISRCHPSKLKVNEEFLYK